MISGVRVIHKESKIEFEAELDNVIRNRTVKDIKFCVNPVIKGSYGSSYSYGEEYYAMVIYDEG